MKYKISKPFKKDKIPKIGRLLTVGELLDLAGEDKKIETLLIKTYVWAKTKKGVRACRLGCFDDGSGFDALDRGVYDRGALRGVFEVKKKIKKELRK